jgi:hypothetical protein
MNNVKLSHPVLQHSDGKIRLIDRNTKIIYLYLDNSKSFMIETDKKIIKFILNGEEYYNLQLNNIIEE